MFIALVDDFSRMTWIYLIKCKFDFAKVFKQLLFYIENQLSSKVKCIRTSNAKELVGGSGLQFYFEHGIKQKSSCSNTPQQNVVV